ncbi:glycoside hydrolase family 43 protein [Stemphylium lycopersici]|uniref:Glycoside hydrolase family 43 protein n=1 Tax=Stemphylium lycopersici TaxID=183478 RepID=A0A364N794_STELY|nr:glycoside hydrolase family 43 protein [Stemphylium lycopersici]RAR13107.1 glycoside hydrolase family 43 protein [Stemphylium lycopersici]
MAINPIIPGFAPDPSLVLVDGTCYLVNSTFHLFPGLPIYTSRDLIHWHQIGNAINRASQLSLSKASTIIHDLGNNDHLYATGGLYAPTIRHHNGTFYIVCTNIVHPDATSPFKEATAQNFIISSTDIHANKWSDPVPFTFNGIDPSLFFDPFSAKAYLCGSKSPGPMTKTTLFEIDVNTGEKLSEEKQLWHGTGGVFPEGPHIYFRAPFYYLLIAEGGTHEGHAVTMARSKTLDGPWEASPRNPVLTAANTDEYVQCTGHCEAFEDRNAEWWGVCLGVRMGGREGWYGLGRETFLTKGTWSEAGWLSFERVNMEGSGGDAVDAGMPDPQGKKLTAQEGVEWLYIRDAELGGYKIDERDVAMMAAPHDLSSANASPCFIGKRQRRLKGASSVTLLPFHDMPSPLTAGIAVYKDEHRFLTLSYTASSFPSITLRVRNKAKHIDRTHTIDNIAHSPSSPIDLSIRYTETQYTVYYKTEPAGEVQEVGKVDSMDLSDKDFVGPIVGIFAVGEHVEVRFTQFVVDCA